MKTAMIICAIITSCLIGAVGVGAGDEPSSEAAKVIEVGPSADFAITLESNRTTGFGWDIAQPVDEKVVKFVSSEYVAADTALAGSGGKEIWTFRAVCPGKAVIHFKYVRPWEKDVPPVRSGAFTVIVK